MRLLWPMMDPRMRHVRWWNRSAEISPVPVVHVWQKDKGYQAARIRNKAIAKARHEYLILIDGDMVLHPAFVKDHLAVARTARFVQGGRALLGKKGDPEVHWNAVLLSGS